MVFDAETRELLHTRPSPLTPAGVAKLQDARLAGPPPHASTDPGRIQRLGGRHRPHGPAAGLPRRSRRHETVAIDVTDTTLTVPLRRTRQQGHPPRQQGEPMACVVLLLELDSHDHPPEGGVADLPEPGVIEDLTGTDVQLAPGVLLARLGDHRVGLER